MPSRRPARSFLALIWLSVLAAAPAPAQSVSGLGAVAGTIRDPSGAVVAGARGQLTNEALGLRRQTATTSAGVFQIPSLTPAGGYRVSVTKDGFAPYEISGLQVQVGQIVTVDVELSLAGTQQTIEVVAEALGVDRARTGVADVVTSEQILNLPINGRRVDSFALLTPGVVPEGNFGLLSFRGIPGGNAFLTDGNDTTNQLWNENAGRTRIASNISQDAVQEFQVLTSGYSAEFGRAVTFPSSPT